METNLAVLSESTNTASLDPHSLAVRVRDFADSLFQSHQIDCTERPKVKWRGFQKAGFYPQLTDRQLAAYKKEMDAGIKKIMSTYRWRYKQFRASLHPRFHSALPEWPNLPAFKTVEEAMSWTLQHAKELSEEFLFYNRQESFLNEFNKMSYLQIAREYPQYLLFKPCSFSLPEGEDSVAWSKRTNRYLYRKFAESGLKHSISCYSHMVDPPSIGFYRVLTFNKELAERIERKKLDPNFYSEMRIKMIDQGCL